MQDLEIGETYGSLHWRNIGPHRGGRVSAVAGHPDDPSTFFFGCGGGGVWKTESGGVVWENVSDGFFGTASMGALAVAPSNRNVVLAGTGEANIRGNVSYGDGVYGSTDGGRTWRRLGLADSRHIGRIRIDPRNEDVFYVAALGHAFGPNAERGVYRSRDGGRTFERVLFVDEDTGAIDLSMDPLNPLVLYAATWQVRRTPHSLTSGGPGSGLYKTGDGGETWTKISDREGFPKGVLGRIGVSASGARSGRVYALAEAADGGMLRSDDGGESWKLVSSNPSLRSRAWYYMHVVADPLDPDTVYALNNF
ncbi:MAG: WD40/YVTN/BNR-like repeat-containing protein, partial [Candidatus Dormibacteraceae bacterium]